MSTPPHFEDGPDERRRNVDFEKLDREMAFLPSHSFVLSAATVTFRENERGFTSVLIVHNINPKYNETFCTLPGGRKNIGETLETAAIRETLEETGYHIHLQPANIPTRATPSRSHEDLWRTSQDHCAPSSHGDPSPTAYLPLPALPEANVALTTIRDVLYGRSKEPVGMVMYSDPLVEDNVTCTKLRFFFYATLADAEREAPAQDHGEHLQAEWMTVPEALFKLRFEAEKQALQTAYVLHLCLRNGMEDVDQEQAILLIMKVCSVSREAAVGALGGGRDIFEVISRLQTSPTSVIGH